MTLKTWLSRECFVGDTVATTEREINIEVEYTYQRASRGARDSLCGVPGAGPPLEPDEPESVEIVSVTDTDSGAEVELTAQEQERIEQQCIEDVEDRKYE